MGIYLNQVGYERLGEKRGVIPFACDHFQIVDEAGKICYEGETGNFGFDIRRPGDGGGFF